MSMMDEDCARPFAGETQNAEPEPCRTGDGLAASAWRKRAWGILIVSLFLAAPLSGFCFADVRQAKTKVLKIASAEKGSDVSIGGLGFQGQFTDPETGLIHAGARVYDPSIGRFLSPDPFPGLISEPKGLNPYTYAFGDPVNYWDPGGAYSMDLHYGWTDDWAKKAAIHAGFSDSFATLMADNIASFDQYHDKEWSLAPNNYGDFDADMTAGGQGNALHFQNPYRYQTDEQMANATAKMPPEVGIGFPGNPFSDPVTANEMRANQYIDPNLIAVEETIAPLYAMKSLAELNTSGGVRQLIANPTGIRGERLLDSNGNPANLTLTAGTARNRLEQAVQEHDPRLFGLALHEYQDTFAHAGFQKWHGMSTANDIFCVYNDPRQDCQYMTTPDGTPLTAEGRVKKELYDRDRMMQNGTDYWMEQFMNNQANHYRDLERVNALNRANKMEKLLNDPLGTIRPEEEMGTRAYVAQAIASGQSGCLELGNGIALPILNSKCDPFKQDFNNQIYR